jgi:hypothetical protein
MPAKPRRQTLYRLTGVAPPRDHRGALAILSILLDRIVREVTVRPSGSGSR